MQSNNTLSHLFGEDKIPYSRLARMLTGSYQWGEINCSKKTNQKYTYYFSCSGHGGFVVAYDMLTPKQKQSLIHFYKGEENIHFDIVAYDALTNKAKAGYKYMSQSSRFNNVRFICFEEDCEWSIASGILGIKDEHLLSLPEEKQNEYINNTLNRWYNNDKYNLPL